LRTPAFAVRRISDIVADFKGVQGVSAPTLPILKAAATHNSNREIAFGVGIVKGLLAKCRLPCDFST
jgi:hypothetical protein